MSKHHGLFTSASLEASKKTTTEAQLFLSVVCKSMGAVCTKKAKKEDAVIAPPKAVEIDAVAGASPF